MELTLRVGVQVVGGRVLPIAGNGILETAAAAASCAGRGRNHGRAGNTRESTEIILS